MLLAVFDGDEGAFEGDDGPEGGAVGEDAGAEGVLAAVGEAGAKLLPSCTAKGDGVSCTVIVVVGP